MSTQPPSFKYDRGQWRGYGDKEWMKFYRPFLRKVTLLEAVFVSELINFAVMRADQTTQKDGWFKVSIKDLKKRLNLSRDTQARLFRGLANLGWVSTKRTGMPPKRWVFVHKDKYEADIFGPKEVTETEQPRLTTTSHKWPI